MAKVGKQQFEDYNRMADSYDATRYEGPVAEFRLAPVLEVITKMIAPTPDMKILDVGVGTGKGALALASSGARVVGLDYTGAMLHIARKKAVEAQLDQVQFLRGNGNQLPFGDAEFDAVISLNFLHLFTPVSNQRVFTNEMHRVLRPGGKLVVELVNLYQGLFLGLARRQFTHDLGFNKPGDIQTLLSPQFEVLRVQGGYFPAMWRVLYPLSKLSLGASRSIEGIAHYWPWKYLAYNVFVEAIRS